MNFEVKAPNIVYTLPTSHVLELFAGTLIGPTCPTGAVPVSMPERKGAKYLDITPDIYLTADLEICGAEAYGFESVRLISLSNNPKDCILTPEQVRVYNAMCRLEVKPIDKKKPTTSPLISTKLSPPTQAPTTTSIPDAKKTPIIVSGITHGALAQGSADAVDATRNMNLREIIYSLCLTFLCFGVPISVLILINRRWEISADSETNHVSSSPKPSQPSTSAHTGSATKEIDDQISWNQSKSSSPDPITQSEAIEMGDHIAGVTLSERNYGRIKVETVEGSRVTYSHTEYITDQSTARPLITREVQEKIAHATGAKEVHLERTEKPELYSTEVRTTITIKK